MKRWSIQSKIKNQKSKIKIDELVDLLLENRGIVSTKEKEEFLHPDLLQVTPENVGIKIPQLKKALKRIEKAISEKEQIIVFGDYDVDGITGSAILWETLHEMGARVMPYIPHRVDEGYGLSVKGISNLKSQNSNLKDVKLIITVDNGIVANSAVDFANSEGIDVIITDHHTVGKELPKAHAIVHTTNLCGSAVAWVVSNELKVKSEKFKVDGDPHLELAALGTIADLVPLTRANRAIVHHGLKSLSRTNRLGLLELFRQAGISSEKIGAYEVGYMIGPRLNAAGRIESAMDSLRLLCTRDKARASDLAERLEIINRERQTLMKDSAIHAISRIKNQESRIKNILIVADESYQEGVIGLIAGKLVEEYYRPSIVIAKRETYSKASVRSVSGFNVIDFLRTSAIEHFVDIGGHPMAAGFTVETAKLQILQETLEKSAEDAIGQDLLTRVVKVDCELPLQAVTTDLYKRIAELEPFGMGNPQPVFVSRGLKIGDIRFLGKDMKHLKLSLTTENASFDAIGFGMADMGKDLHKGDEIDIAYVIDENTWNGQTKIQLKLKDIQTE